MIITDLDAVPTDPSESTARGWTDASTVTVKPRPYLWARARRTVLRLREALTRLGILAVSAPLRLSWRLDVTVGVDAEVAAADPDAARTALQRFLHDTARVVAVTPGPGLIGWRELGGVPGQHVGEIVAESDDLEDPLAVWAVSTVVTASFIVVARDAALVDGYSYADLTPYLEAWPIRRLLAGNGDIRRTPVRRRHLR